MQNTNECILLGKQTLPIMLQIIVTQFFYVGRRRKQTWWIKHKFHETIHLSFILSHSILYFWSCKYYEKSIDIVLAHLLL